MEDWIDVSVSRQLKGGKDRARDGAGGRVMLNRAREIPGSFS